jgi:UDPglucose 6-dehydrogenase
VHSVRLGVGADERIGSRYLYAGPGYGGSCLPKDVQALLHTASEHGCALELASATDRVNHRQRSVVLRTLRHHFRGELRGKRILLWGVAFKPRTDDVREAPALTLIEGLLAEGASVVTHDPKAGEEVRKRFGSRVVVVDDAYEGAEDADALALMTEWREYQNPDFDELERRMRRPLLIDARNIWSGYGLRKRGFEYDGIGVRGS